jgi:type IV secretory pathway protease TraF
MHALLAPKQPQAAPAAAAPTVAIRGGLAIAAVRLTGKRYNVTAGHNVGWWQQCQQAAGGGTASVAALVQAGVPAIFVGYVVRRGYMVAA